MAEDAPKKDLDQDDDEKGAKKPLKLKDVKAKKNKEADGVEDGQKKGKRTPFREFDPKKFVDTEPTMNEAQTKNLAVMSFGRMNPPTVGHESLANKVLNVAMRSKGDPFIYLSHSQDKKKNPLTYDDKISYAQTAFGSMVKKSRARTIIDVAKELAKTYKNLMVVAGSDRVDEFDKLLNKYNGKDFKFDSIQVVSAGERDPDADGVSGMSASKMRAAVASGNRKAFKSGLPKKLASVSDTIFDNLEKKMNEEVVTDIDILSDEVESNLEALDRTQRRKRSVLMKKLAPKIARAKKKAAKKTASSDKLKDRAKKQALGAVKKVVAGKKDYDSLSIDAKMKVDDKAKKKTALINRIAKKLLPKLKAKEKERVKSMRSGKSEDASYHSGVSKSTSDKRKAQFNKQAKMDDDNPKAYKPAPGDATAKTKPSTHTKKFASMYGEMKEPIPGAIEKPFLKKPHMALNANNSPKLDGRFKQYKKWKQQVPKELEAEVKKLAEQVEEFVEGKKVDKPSTNPVAKHSRNKSGAGAHKSSKDYDRKNKKADIDSQLSEAELYESNPEKALKNKAEKSGMPYGILKKVFDRGVAAWKSGHRPGTTPAQWGMARVNSFATKSSGTWGKADSDLAAKI